MADDIVSKVALLKRICGEAYAANPNSCSHSVWHVIKAITDADKTYEQANALIATLSKTWTEIDVATAGKLANEGKVVVGGLTDTPNGHVVIVYPGALKARGGYKAKKKDGIEFQVRQTGLYPLAMSTSIGSWPGAMSNGDKTVWDPWGNDDKFAAVKFWHKDVASSKTANATAANTRYNMCVANGWISVTPRASGQLPAATWLSPIAVPFRAPPA